MINPERLTIVQALTLNACWASYIYNNLDKSVWNFTYRQSFNTVSPEKFDLILSILNAKHLLIKNKNCWTFKKSLYNRCHKLAWPSVKLTGYTRSQALAEAREVIELVKERYAEQN